MVIDVEINQQVFELGDALDKKSLARARFKKVPVVRKLLDKSPLHEKQYVAKNCKVNCFDGAFELYPCQERYLDPDRRWKTAVNLYYQDDQLRRVLIRVLDGHYAAPNFLARFQEICEKMLGQPCSERKSLTRWEYNGFAIATLMMEDGHNASFLMALDE